MRVCMIAEGSYPYVSGGVSSWVNQLISSMPEIEFSILSIMAKRGEFTEYKYPCHENIAEIKTIYLNDFRELNPKSRRLFYKLDGRMETELEKFMSFDESIDWRYFLTRIIDRKQVGTAVDFLQSRYFYKAVVDVYSKNFRYEGFNEFYWSLRSMYLPMINLLQSYIPKADVYHSVSTGYSGIMGMIAKESYNKPLVLTEHGIYAREREEDIIKAKWVKGSYKSLWIEFFYFLSKGVYRHADEVLALFNRNLEIQRELGANHAISRVIVNGVDTKRFSPEKKEHKGFIIGAVLRIVPIKDVKTLIRAFKIVRDRIDEDAKLLLIGPYEEDIEYYEECLSIIKNLNLQDDIEFTGLVDIREYMKIIDVMVLTSISEGQPLVILEAMASQIPFVASDVGACREMIEGSDEDKLGPAGIVTKPVSPSQTADAIVRILEDPQKARAMGEAGRKRVERYYAKEMMVDEYRKIYRKFGG